MNTSSGLSSAHISPDVEAELDQAKRTHAWYGMHRPRIMQVDSVHWSEGGNVVRFKTAALLSKPPACTNRGKVQEFSRQSRHRLLVFINSIDRRKLPAERMWFVTLTYPAVWPPAPEVWKQHLQAFQKRVRREFGCVPALWKLEPQRRGAPHFHLLMCMPATMCCGLEIVGKEKRGERIVTHWRGGELAAFRAWLSHAWFEVVGSGDVKHLHAGTNCEPLEAWGKVTAYAAKYLGKECVFQTQDGSTRAIGRYWGVWHRSQLPLTWAGKHLPFASWAMLRRTIRRLHQRQRIACLRDRVRSATVFVAWETIERLLQWLEPLHQQLYQRLGSVQSVMKLVRFDGDINDWFQFGEEERQNRHRDQQSRSRVRFSAQVVMGGAHA